MRRIWSMLGLIAYVSVLLAVSASAATRPDRSSHTAPAISASATAVVCTPAEKAQAMKALTSFRRSIAAKRTAYFRAHKSAKARRAFVKHQNATLKRLKAAARCQVPQPPSPPEPAPVPPPPAAGLYIAIGDSIAVGVGASSRDNGFVAVYFARLRASGLVLQLSNRAVSGATASTVLSDQLPQALRDIADPSDAKLVTVTVGTNDAAGTACRSVSAPDCPFAANLRAIVERLQGALSGDPGDEKIQIMDRYNYAVGTPQEPRAAVEIRGTDDRLDCGDTGWNDVVYCLTIEKHATFVDTYTPMLVGGRAYLADGLHPTDAGHFALALAFDRARFP